MEIIPAIDLKDGRCVRLRQGDMETETVYSVDPVAVAVQWQDLGANLIHLVDLNGAVEGHPRNVSEIHSIVTKVSPKVQVGGGIRTIESIRRYLSMGVWRVVLGTAALRDRALLDQACRGFPDRIVLGLDAKDGKVAVQGWTSVANISAAELLQELAGYPLAAVVYTDIAKDGMLTGPNLPGLRAVLEHCVFPIIASGGISRLDDIRAIRGLGPRVQGAIVGKALYDGKFTLPEAIRAAGCHSDVPC
jgi:phosphoribosylformimino-5-aminoimidazole carboxamide ribotide isomerase